MTKPTTELSPKKSINRIHYLDALRGIAVFFIFTANIPYLSGYFFFKNRQTLPWANFKFDEIFEIILHTLVDGKFYSIFSLLFGIGFAIQYENLKKQGLPFKPFFRRRMFWLLIFGGIIVKGGKNPGGQLFTLISDENGVITLKNLPKGNYKFKIMVPTKAENPLYKFK